MQTIKEIAEHHVAVYEIDGKFYPVRVDSHNFQVYSLAPSDQPRGGSGCWFGRLSDAGIKYVARGRSRAAAMAVLRRYVKSMESTR